MAIRPRFLFRPFIFGRSGPRFLFRLWFLFRPMGERRAIWNDGAIAIAPYGDLYDHVNVVGHYNVFINDAFFSYNGNVFDFVFHDTSVFG
jgi:hypothetical protein